MVDGPSGSEPIADYAAAVDYLYARLPMFTRVGEKALKADLTNTVALCDALDNPHSKFRSIHIAGTNGKGSTSHMLAAILQKAGYKTGLYTSPHLKDFRERIRINGVMIGEQDVVDFINAQQTVIELINPSFFEATVAMAFNYFAEQQVDIAVIEVGLGGRLDSTNVISPVLSVITNIGFDHVDILGNTLPQIAFEKAGIIKPGVPVVISEKNRETEPVFRKQAAANDARIVFAEDVWTVTPASTSPGELLDLRAKRLDNRSPDLHLEADLTGTYQAKNIAGVLTAVDELRKLDLSITDQALREGLAATKQLTGLMGRWQVLGTSPLTICDTGHNAEGIREVVKNISLQKYDRLHIVLGMVQDKDITRILSLLPPDAVYYFCSPDLPRAKPANELQMLAAVNGLIGNSYPSVFAALEAAKHDASVKDLIFVGGSTFVVAEVI